ncbi:hypothetical protein KIN20_022646 [Parelaphostrongylus tenuis]|uniref:VWFA domain-containing protein n=1 Tax=Parelaphostrongylus tenuis TaxID=148309 RepID=A0AAD5QWW2_PARTN|nr:hypothetical protein KIN20_022646 [Parelaphostrongylus tenuis]
MIPIQKIQLDEVQMTYVVIMIDYGHSSQIYPTMKKTIFSQSKDRVAIVLFGFEKTKNSIGVPAVYLEDDAPLRTSFDHLRFLSHKVKANLKNSGNVVDALYVATNFLEEKILTNASAECEYSDDDVSDLTRRIIALEANLVVVGFDDDSSRKHAKRTPVLSEIVKLTDGISTSFKLVLNVI